MVAITSIKRQVALREIGNPATFSFSRVWHVPCRVLNLSLGKMAQLSGTFLVADDDTVCQDLPLGLLRRLWMDSRSLLEQNWSSFDGTNCAGIETHQAPSAASRLKSLIVAQRQRDDEEQSNEPLPNPPNANCFDH